MAENSTPHLNMKIQFGQKMREQFLFDDGWTNMNHGSFGAVPRYVRDGLHEKQRLLESTPDLFVRFDYHRHLLESRKAIAELVDAPVQSIVLIPNATVGVDTILRNLVYTPFDHIIIFDTLYGTGERTTYHLAETTGVKVSRIPLVYPISDSAILSMFLQTVDQIRKQGEEVRVAVFDVISFQPGVRTPFEALVAACRKLNILSCVDGAHCVGQLPINLPQLDPDFFVSSLHKWLFVPRGCAILYAPVRNQPLLRTTFPTSWGFLPKRDVCNSAFKQSDDWHTPFEVLFESIGTMDYSPFLCIPAALEFRRNVCGGEGEILQYNCELAARGGRIMARILGTQVLDNAAGTMTKGCSMVNILLPLGVDVLSDDLLGMIDDISKTLAKNYKTFVPVFEHGGCLWARVSAQIYLDEDDFIFLGKALKEICAELRRIR